MAPRGAQERPRSKRLQETPEVCPGAAQDSPKARQEQPKRGEVCPRSPKEPPRWPQEGPRSRLQEAILELNTS